MVQPIGGVVEIGIASSGLPPLTAWRRLIQPDGRRVFDPTGAAQAVARYVVDREATR